MEVIAFWTAVVVVVIYFKVTTRAQRRRWVWQFWTALFIAGAAGALASALR